MIKRNDGISKDDICQNQFTAYVVLAVKRKRQSYIKKKQRDNEKENRTKKEAEQSEFRTAGYDMWSRMEPQNEKLMAAMQQLSLKERFVVTEYALKGKPFKEIAQETGLKEKGVASAYYRSIKKLRAEIADILQHDFSPLFDLRVKDRNSIHAVEHSKGAGWGQQRACHTGAVNLYHFKAQFFHLAGIIKNRGFNAARTAATRHKYRRLFISINHRACIQHRDIGLRDTMQPQTAGRG